MKSTTYLPHAASHPALDATIRLTYVDPKEIDGIWERVVPFLAPSVELVAGRHTVEDIRCFLAVEAMQLFVIWSELRLEPLGVLVTEILDHKGGRALQICHLGGKELATWIDKLNGIETWAKDLGCRWIEVPGRYGWAKVLSRMGYQPFCITMTKELV